VVTKSPRYFIDFNIIFMAATIENAFLQKIHIVNKRREHFRKQAS
jgi:hypothetical protein